MASSNQGNNKQGGSQGSHGNDASGRGFAGMDPERQREIAAEGGRASHKGGSASTSSSGGARDAGTKTQGAQGGNQDGQGSGQGGRSSGSDSGSGSRSGAQGGTSEQHAQAGRQSHKNDR